MHKQSKWPSVQCSHFRCLLCRRWSEQTLEQTCKQCLTILAMERRSLVSLWLGYYLAAFYKKYISTLRNMVKHCCHVWLWDGPMPVAGDVTLLVRRTTAPLHSLHLPLLLPPPAQLCLLCSTYKGFIKKFISLPISMERKSAVLSISWSHDAHICRVRCNTPSTWWGARNQFRASVWTSSSCGAVVWSYLLHLISPVCVWCVPGAGLDTRH